MPATRIHHVNFVVRELEVAIQRFERLLGIGPFEIVDHPARRARTARARIGESWFVLVSPEDPESVPGRHLKERGEGFFLLSVGVDDLDAELRRLEAHGVDVEDLEPRQGIVDWRIADIGEVHGALLQLADES